MASIAMVHNAFLSIGTKQFKTIVTSNNSMLFGGSSVYVLCTNLGLAWVPDTSIMMVRMSNEYT